MTAPVSVPVSVVTGSNSGIGRATAVQLAGRGHEVYATLRNLDAAGKLLAMAAEAGVEVHPVVMDIADDDSVRQGIGGVLAQAGRVDVLVNNAGYNAPKPALQYSEEEFDYIVDVNLKGVFFMSTLVAQSMIDHGIPGSIITITSQVALVGAPLRSVYSAAKGGAGSLTRTLAGEWAPHKITVNAVAPTFTRTPLLEEALKNPAFARNLEKVPMGRTAEPEEIAAAVVYLASDAARMVTGHVLCVDGGFTAV
jgi:gluconate 5-dehydrogenase